MNERMPIREYTRKVRVFHDTDAEKYVENRYGDRNITQFAYNVRRGIATSMMNTVGGRILDIGCGPGTFVSAVTREDRNIFAFDLSFQMVDQAKKRNTGNEQVFYSVGNLTELAFGSETLDGVLCIGVMGYIPTPDKAFAEMYRVMKHGAEAVVQISNAASVKERIYERWLPSLKKMLGIKKKAGWGFDFPLYSYSKKNFDKTIETSGFEIVDWSFYDFHIPFLERLSMELAIRASKWLQRFGRKRAMSFLGSGYLAKIRKT